ncbi:hypothetical protein G9A89_018227 [Geosiphon pyriformis]|nr:hypothetical protein G9A89_018227 [Geosiphon pyriformis]
MAESKRVKESHIKLAINKRMESFELNKSHTIRSILEHPFHKIILDHLVVNDKVILEPGSVRSRVDEIMEGWTRKHRMVPNVPDVWHCQYWPLDYIFDEAFSGIMQPIEFLELFGMVSDLPIGKAAGLSVLIKTVHKILSKILSNRILLACSVHEILHGDNFSVLKSTTTQTLIFAIGSVVEDALEKNRELWLILQNMRKAYDSVGWEHLKKCLVRIKMSGRAKSHAGFSTFFAAGAFVDNTIWVGSSQTATQHILNIANEFFRINDISINNNKTVAIPINSRISNLSLFISGSPIFIAKKGKSHQYLGIFLSIDGFSKPSLAKAHSDVHFFSNLVLKKAVSDKQFLYLVSAVLQPIVSYRMQFSFVPVSVCDKWDALIRKGGSLASSFWFHNGVPISTVLGEFLFFKYLPSLQCYGIAFVDQLQDCHGDIFNWYTFKRWKKLDPRGPVPEWFGHSVAFLSGVPSSPLALSGVGPVNICGSDDFVSVCDHLSWVGTDSLSVYTDGLVKNLGMTGCKARAAAFFEDINLGLGVCV